MIYRVWENFFLKSLIRVTFGIIRRYSTLDFDVLLRELQEK